MRRDAYTLVACALAWCWGRAGHSVLLADADPLGSVRLLAAGGRGACDWRGVRYLDRLPNPGEARDFDLVVVDGPALLGSAAAPVLARADGLLLTCLADPLSLRTLPAAARAIEAARAANPKLDVLGLLIGAHDPTDALQEGVLGRLRRTQAGLLIEPPVPYQTEVQEWPSAPGAGLPSGPAAGAYDEIARTLEAWIGLGTAA
jgi:cellulose biosynthesis protein BcsQ